MTDEQQLRPVTVKLTTWWGFAFAGVFLLYGGVQIILGVLDNTYETLGQSIIFAVIGAALLLVVYAYVGHKTWGWYGMIVVNALIVLGSLLQLRRYESVVLIVLSAGALYLLFAGPTREYLSRRT